MRWTPSLTVMLASMVPTLPIITTAPTAPPWGYMLFVAWRLMHREIWYPWAGAALGLYDDLWSGAPLGTGVVLWSATQLIFSLIDRRNAWRDHWQDWALSASFIGLMLSAALVIANETGGHTPWLIIVPQILIAALLQPLVMRLCARVDQWRFA